MLYSIAAFPGSMQNLDRNLIKDMRRGRVKWDSEHLVRRLAHVEFDETDGDTLYLPLGLRN